MTPERRNSSLLGNGGKQVSVEMYTHTTIEALPFIYNVEVNTLMQQQGNCYETVFSVCFVPKCYKEDSLKQCVFRGMDDRRR
jgi:hypothetical protein